MPYYPVQPSLAVNHVIDMDYETKTMTFLQANVENIKTLLTEKYGASKAMIAGFFEEMKHMWELVVVPSDGVTEEQKSEKIRELRDIVESMFANFTAADSQEYDTIQEHGDYEGDDGDYVTSNLAEYTPEQFVIPQRAEAAIGHPEDEFILTESEQRVMDAFLQQNDDQALFDTEISEEFVNTSGTVIPQRQYAGLSYNESEPLTQPQSTFVSPGSPGHIYSFQPALSLEGIIRQEMASPWSDDEQYDFDAMVSMTESFHANRDNTTVSSL